MDKAQEIKIRVSMQDILHRYGYQTNRAGFLKCPFHSGDNTASLKVYKGDRGWHCFGCGKGGSVIDFVMEHDGLSFQDSCKRIDSHFSLNLYRELTFLEYREAKIREAEVRKAREKEQKEIETDQKCRKILCSYHRWLWRKPTRTPEIEKDLQYVERLLDNLDRLNFDPIARVNVLISKHIERGGSYACIRNFFPDV